MVSIRCPKVSDLRLICETALPLPISASIKGKCVYLFVWLYKKILREGLWIWYKEAPYEQDSYSPLPIPELGLLISFILIRFLRV